MLKAYDMREGTWTNSPMQRPPTVLSHSVVALDQTSPMVVSLGFAKLLVMGQPVHEVGGWGMPDKPAAKKRFVWFADKLRSYVHRPTRLRSYVVATVVGLVGTHTHGVFVQ